MPRPHIFGFDLDVARRNLIAWLVENGVLAADWLEELKAQWRDPIDIGHARDAMVARGRPADEIERLVTMWTTTRDERANMTEVEVDWALVWCIAFEHGQLHFMPDLNSSIAPCPNGPLCKAGAVSFALFELHSAYREQRAPALDIADDLLELSRELQTIAPLLRKLRQASLAEQREYTRLRSMLNLRNAPWGKCLRVLHSLEVLADDGLSRQVRQLLSSSEFNHVGATGRPRQALLTALWQHLRAAGFSYRRISDLVPDQNPARGVEHRKGRVRTAVKGPDRRTMWLYVPGFADSGTLTGT